MYSKRWFFNSSIPLLLALWIFLPLLSGQETSLDALIAYPAHENCQYYPEQMCQLAVFNPQTRTHVFIKDFPGLEPSSMRWSPDGNKLAFIYRPDNNFDIGIINTDGTDFHRLTKTDADEGFLAWSPDAEQLAFNRGDDFDWHLFVSTLENWNPMQLTEGVRVLGEIQWSPDGENIWFTGVDVDTTEREPNQIYVTTVDGSRLTNLTESATLSESILSFSSDGNAVLFRSSNTDTDHIPRPVSLQIMDLDSGNRYIILDERLGVGNAGWAYDNEHIIYQLAQRIDEENPQLSLYLLNLIDEKEIQLPTSLPIIIDFDIAPDGRQIAYIGREETDTDICIMNLTDFEEFCLGVEPSQSGTPTWGH